ALIPSLSLLSPSPAPPAIYTLPLHDALPISDLGAEAELLAVDEAGRGVDQDGGRVDLGGEAVRGPEVGRDDGLAVTRAVAGDVVDGLVQAVDHPDRQLQVEELVRPVVLGGGRHPVLAQRGAGRLVADELDTLEAGGDLGEEAVGHRPVHE